jgi:thiamine biosynthesis lipoprotein
MKTITKLFLAFGTLNRIEVYHDYPSLIFPVLSDIEQRFLDMDNRLSVFKETSEISQINAAAGTNYVPVSDDTFTMIALAKEYAEMTHGAFDLTANPLTRLWRKGKVPSSDDVEKSAKLVNYRHVLFRDKQVKLAKRGMSLDMGGIAKGYAADLAKEMLLHAGVQNALINLGGTIVTIGQKQEIDIKNPFQKQTVSMRIAKSSDEVIVTSGIYEKHFVQDGKIYHHIIDTKSGFPAASELASVTLLGQKGTELDALATACITLGIKRSMKLLSRRNINAVFFLLNGQIFATTEMQNRIKGDQ